MAMQCGYIATGHWLCMGCIYRYLEDDKVVRQGDMSDGMYFVVHGVIGITDLDDKLKNTLNEGDYFGGAQ